MTYDRQLADHLRYLKNKVTTHTCIVCSTQFKADHKRKYCSIQCNPNIRIWDRSVRLCKSCGNQYKPKFNKQKYCCRQCQPYGKDQSNTFYQSREWKLIRATFIQSTTLVNGIQLSNEYCIECYIKHNRLNDMYAVDHIIRVKDGGTHDHSNLQ